MTGRRPVHEVLTAVTGHLAALDPGTSATGRNGPHDQVVHEAVAWR